MFKGKFFKTVGAIFRGILKGNPIGNVIVETVQAFQNKISDGEKGKPHNPVSIIFQLITIICIFFLFYAKVITMDQIITMLKNVLSLNVQ